MDKLYDGIYSSLHVVWIVVELNSIWDKKLKIVHLVKIVNDWLQINSIVELRKSSSFRRNSN